MNIKWFIFILLSLIVFGFLVATSFSGVMSLLGFAPSNEEIMMTNLMSVCNGKALVYSRTLSELDKKNFCCASSDLNNNGNIESNEYCANLCSNCNVPDGVITVCRDYLDYVNCN